MSMETSIKEGCIGMHCDIYQLCGEEVCFGPVWAVSDLQTDDIGLQECQTRSFHKQFKLRCSYCSHIANVDISHFTSSCISMQATRTSRTFQSMLLLSQISVHPINQNLNSKSSCKQSAKVLKEKMNDWTAAVYIFHQPTHFPIPAIANELQKCNNPPFC